MERKLTFRNPFEEEKEVKNGFKKLTTDDFMKKDVKLGGVN